MNTPRKRVLREHERPRLGDLVVDPRTGRTNPWQGERCDTATVIRTSPWPYRQLFVDLHLVVESQPDVDGTQYRPFPNLPAAQQAAEQIGRAPYLICDLRGRALAVQDPPEIVVPPGCELLQPGDLISNGVLLSDWADGKSWRYPEQPSAPNSRWEYSNPHIACRQVTMRELRHSGKSSRSS